jgi:hypothetical protein
MGLTRQTARRILGAVSVIGGLGVLLFFSAQILSGRYSGQEDAAWKWFVPNIVPLTGLVSGGLITEFMQRTDSDEAIDSYSLWFSVGLCIIYIIALLGSIMFASVRYVNPLPHLQTANLYLGFLQGLVAAALGVYFTRVTTGGQSDTPRSPP